MVRFVLGRLVSIGVMLLAMSMLVFCVTQMMPGNVAKMILGQFATPDAQAALELRLGLDAPFHDQYLRWAGGFVVGDFGTSLILERPVADLVGTALGYSAVLAGLAFVLVAVVGIGFGVVAALNRRRPIDHAISLVSFIGIGLPEFFWGLVLILVFARWLQWLPSGGIADPADGIVVMLSHLILPVMTLTLALTAHVARLTRSSMLEALETGYVRHARAKGIPERAVLFDHALRNALQPTVAVLAIDVGWLIGGIVVVETVFSYPGLGRLLVFSIERRDLPVIQAGILTITAVYALCTLAADILAAWLDPRLRDGC